MVMSAFQRHYLLVLDFVCPFTYQEFDSMSIACLHSRNVGAFHYLHVHIGSHKNRND